MNHLYRVFAVVLLIGVSSGCHTLDKTLVHREWMVDGVAREALVHLPPAGATNAAPVIFAFHGHGGSMERSAEMFNYQALWPEAIVVYMQGLHSPGKLSDSQGKKPGWQFAVGEEGDRDLKFFDAALASLEHEYRVDERRIYASGHSNGGAFTYLLWAARGDRFAAFVISGSAAPDLLTQLKPKPLLAVTGRNDPFVKPSMQRETIDAVRKINECGEGQTGERFCTIYPSKIGATVETYIFRGTHNFLPGAQPVAVKFMKDHPKP